MIASTPNAHHHPNELLGPIDEYVERSRRELDALEEGGAGVCVTCKATW